MTGRSTAAKIAAQIRDQQAHCIFIHPDHHLMPKENDLKIKRFLNQVSQELNQPVVYTTLTKTADLYSLESEVPTPWLKAYQEGGIAAFCLSDEKNAWVKEELQVKMYSLLGGSFLCSNVLYKKHPQFVAFVYVLEGDEYIQSVLHSRFDALVFTKKIKGLN